MITSDFCNWGVVSCGGDLDQRGAHLEEATRQAGVTSLAKIDIAEQKAVLVRGAAMQGHAQLAARRPHVKQLQQHGNAPGHAPAQPEAVHHLRVRDAI